MSFSFKKMIADEQGMDPDSDEFRTYMKELRARRKEQGSSFQMVPCGPTCPICEDNSYDCGCPPLEDGSTLEGSTPS